MVRDYKNLLIRTTAPVLRLGEEIMPSTYVLGIAVAFIPILNGFAAA